MKLSIQHNTFVAGLDESYVYANDPTYFYTRFSERTYCLACASKQGEEVFFVENPQLIKTIFDATKLTDSAFYVGADFVECIELIHFTWDLARTAL